jgi:hypothetical protein
VATLPQLRISDTLMQALDRAAAARGVGRPELIRNLLAAGLVEQAGASNGYPGSDPKPLESVVGPADLTETLILLADRARAGVVSAQVALLRHYQRTSNGSVTPSDPLAEVDEIARRRLQDQHDDGDAA